LGAGFPQWKSEKLFIQMAEGLHMISVRVLQLTMAGRCWEVVSSKKKKAWGVF
jgi:hypothetical protein